MTEATVNTKAKSGIDASVAPTICLASLGPKKELGSNIPEADSVVIPQLRSHILQHTIKKNQVEEVKKAN